MHMCVWVWDAHGTDVWDVSVGVCVVHMCVGGRREGGRQACSAPAPTLRCELWEMWGGHRADPALCSDLECVGTCPVPGGWPRAVVFHQDWVWPGRSLFSQPCLQTPSVTLVGGGHRLWGRGLGGARASHPPADEEPEAECACLHVHACLRVHVSVYAVACPRLTVCLPGAALLDLGSVSDPTLLPGNVGSRVSETLFSCI